jgi:hypothetical protein
MVDKAFSYPLSNQFTPLDFRVLWIDTKVKKACPEMMRKILVA